jgi:glycosyltransferase involved in cell wall biosynthesis
MIIAVNTRALVPGQMEEHGYFIQEVFSRLAKEYPRHQFYFLFDRPFSDEVVTSSNIKPVVVKPLSKSPFSWNIWYNWTVPAILKKIKADVFVSADGFCSLRTKVPQCIVVHELAFLHYPQFTYKPHLNYYKKKTTEFLRKASTIATVSEFSKLDICNQYEVDEQKVHVVYKGVNEVFRPLEYEEKEKIKQQYADGCEYFICTGAVNPCKNLINLLKAFSVFKKKQKSNMKLVICGRPAQKTAGFTKLLNTFKFRNDVKLTGYVSKRELALLTASAYAMVYPSYFEGFGVPPLEALHCGVPAIVSRTSALPEIGGDGYLYVNPDSFEDIAEKMMLLYKDEALRNKLIENGTMRLNLFSWEQTVKKMWECIELAARPE